MGWPRAWRRRTALRMRAERKASKSSSSIGLPPSEAIPGQRSRPAVRIRPLHSRGRWLHGPLFRRTADARALAVRWRDGNAALRPRRADATAGAGEPPRARGSALGPPRLPSRGSGVGPDEHVRRQRSAPRRGGPCRRGRRHQRCGRCPGAGGATAERSAGVDRRRHGSARTRSRVLRSPGLRRRAQRFRTAGGGPGSGGGGPTRARDVPVVGGAAPSSRRGRLGVGAAGRGGDDVHGGGRVAGWGHAGGDRRVPRRPRSNGVRGQLQRWARSREPCSRANVAGLQPPARLAAERRTSVLRRRASDVCGGARLLLGDGAAHGRRRGGARGGLLRHDAGVHRAGAGRAARGGPPDAPGRRQCANGRTLRGSGPPSGRSRRDSPRASTAATLW